MRIGRFDLWNETDAMAAVMNGHNRALELAHASALANNPIQCWQIAKESLLEFGCDAGQATQLMSNIKDIRHLDLCINLDPMVHVLRAYLGRCAYRNRLNMSQYSNKYPSIQAEECIGSGIIVIGPDELPITDNQRNNLMKELYSINGTLAKTPESMVLNQNGEPRAGFSASHTLLQAIAPLLREVTGYSDRKIWEELSRTAFVQKVLNSPEDNDVQKVLHQDTWHDAWKLWYFPDDIKSGEGTFRYAPYSHGLSSARLRLLKEFATKNKQWEEWRSHGHSEGSWRISDEELQGLAAMRLPWQKSDESLQGSIASPWPWRKICTTRAIGDETINDPDEKASYDIEASAGTLVLANVYGYHARGLANEFRERISLHASIRLNPWE